MIQHNNVISLSSPLAFGATGRQGILYSFDTPIFISDLVPPGTTVFHGSTVVIEEVLTIDVKVDNEGWIDRDFNWFEPKEYLGTLQLLPPAPTQYRATNDDSQFITNQHTEVRRYSSYLVGGTPGQNLSQLDQFQVNQCNFSLIPTLTQVGPAFIPGYVANNAEPQFIGSISKRSADISPREYIRQIGGFGLFMYPGVSYAYDNYTVAAINILDTNLEPLNVPTCALPVIDCDTQFNKAMLALNDGVNPGTPGYPIFYTIQSALEAKTLNQTVTNMTFNCSDGQTRDYYVVG